MPIQVRQPPTEKPASLNSKLKLEGNKIPVKKQTHSSTTHNPIVLVALIYGSFCQFGRKIESSPAVQQNTTKRETHLRVEPPNLFQSPSFFIIASVHKQAFDLSQIEICLPTPNLANHMAYMFLLKLLKEFTTHP